MSITSIKVPPAVESGSESVVLDCEYILAAHEKQGLVVQWFFRDHPVPVYQWIPGKRPQVSGLLKGRINLDHHASEDPYHRHRALEIIKATTDVGGDYRCKVLSRYYVRSVTDSNFSMLSYQVASFDNEDYQTAKMVVYGKHYAAFPLRITFLNCVISFGPVPAEKFTVDQETEGSSVVNVTCNVEGVYPKPQVALFQQNGSHGSR